MRYLNISLSSPDLIPFLLTLERVFGESERKLVNTNYNKLTNLILSVCKEIPSFYIVLCLNARCESSKIFHLYLINI